MINNTIEEDLRLYEEIIEEYNQLETEDIELAYDLSKKCLLVANRWNEIMLNSAKYSKDLDTSKTIFKDWAYHRYRILMTAHEFCRVVWRQGKEEMNNTFYKEM